MLNPRPYWNFDDPAASEATFRQLLETTTDEVDRIIVQTQIARALGLQGNFEEGMNLIDSVADVDHITLAWRAIEMGRLHRSKGEAEPAGANFILAISQTEPEEGVEQDPVVQALHIDALHMYALMLPPAEQIDFTREAIDKAAMASDPLVRNWLPSLENNLGMAYTELGDWQSGLTQFRGALEDSIALGGESRIFIARYMVGWALRNLGRTDEAFNHMTNLKADLTAAGRTDEYVDAELKLLAGEKN
jgi:tetratricopeptide (TPR) repeat protein